MAYVFALAVVITVIRFASAVRREGSPRVLLEIPAGAAAGLLAGLWLGVAARCAMRVIALAAGAPERFSLSGSLQVVGFFAVVGGVLGVLYAGLFRHALASSGFAFGVLVLFVSWYPLSEEAVQLIPERPPAVTILLASGAVLSLMWLPFALLLESSISRIHHRVKNCCKIPGAGQIPLSSCSRMTSS